MGGGGDRRTVDSATENRCSLVVGILSCSPTCVCHKCMCMYTHCICTWGNIKLKLVKYSCFSVLVYTVYAILTYVHTGEMVRLIFVLRCCLWKSFARFSTPLFLL